MTKLNEVLRSLSARGLVSLLVSPCPRPGPSVRRGAEDVRGAGWWVWARLPSQCLVPQTLIFFFCTNQR